jgi:hypothetical protein
MASDRASLVALRELIADTDLTLETIPDLPQNRTAHCRENLRAALALADDLLKQSRKNLDAAKLGHKGGKFLSDSQHDPHHPGNVSRDYGSCLRTYRTAGVKKHSALIG